MNKSMLQSIKLLLVLITGAFLLLGSANLGGLTANAGVDQTITEGQSVTLDGSKSTADEGETLTGYKWSEGSTVYCENAKICTVDNLSKGEHYITLTVTQSDGLTATDRVKVKVEAQQENGADKISSVTSPAMAGATIELYDDQNRLLLKKSNAIDSSGAYSVSFDADDEAKLSDFFVLKATKGDKEIDSVIIGYWGDDGFSGDASYLSYDSTAAYLIALYTGDTTFENIKRFLLSFRNGAFDKTDIDSYKYPYRHIIEQVSTDVKNYIEGHGAKPTKESILAYTATQNIIPVNTLNTIAQEDGDRFATSFVFEQDGKKT